MAVTLTVNLSDPLGSSLREAAKEDGVSENSFAETALKDYLYLRRFRLLRSKLQLEQGRSYSDEEIFDLVS